MHGRPINIKFLFGERVLLRVIWCLGWVLLVDQKTEDNYSFALYSVCIAVTSRDCIRIIIETVGKKKMKIWSMIQSISIVS